MCLMKAKKGFYVELITHFYPTYSIPDVSVGLQVCV